MTLGWHIDALDPGAAADDYAPYVHLMRGSQMLAQHDGMPFPSARWAAGETLYSWFDLPLPNGLPVGDYTLRAGMYTRPAVRRIPRLGPSGQEDGEFTLGAVALPLAL